MRHLSALLLAASLLSPLPAHAQPAEAPPPPRAVAAEAPGPKRSPPLDRDALAAPEPAEDKLDFMRALARRGLHDLQNERWNAYGQITLIGQAKPAFGARYSNVDGTPYSLMRAAEGSFTGSATLFLGARLWPGAEVYVVPEVISERPLSGLHGLGGIIQNAELQKGGSAAPTVYLSRAYLRQTIDLGGARVARRSDALALGATLGARRLVFTVGNFSVLDFLEKNSYSGDLRRQFLNMAFLTHAAYDFAADARGYTWGAVAELYLDDFAVRAAHIVAPRDPNQLPLDFRFWKYFGDQVEVEHRHVVFGLPGVVRVLGYLNRENMGRFDEALAAQRADPAKNATTCTSFSYVPAGAGAGNATAPDLCWARRPNYKLGVGVNVEQALSDDVGAFFRAMYSDGRTEVYSYTATDRSLSLGLLLKGTPWHRPGDSAGLAFGLGWISEAHVAYLNAGGIDGFIGDGRIRPAPESAFEIFYSLNLVPSLWLSADFQHLTNPAYNAERGPVEIIGGRLHSEF
jgi:hypothetical protein